MNPWPPSLHWANLPTELQLSRLCFYILISFELAWLFVSNSLFIRSPNANQLINIYKIIHLWTLSLCLQQVQTIWRRGTLTYIFIKWLHLRPYANKNVFTIFSLYKISTFTARDIAHSFRVLWYISIMQKYNVFKAIHTLSIHFNFQKS